MFDRTTRRRVLCAAATLPAVALAGCTSEPVDDGSAETENDGDDEPTQPANDDTAETDYGDDTPTTEDAPDAERLPTELPTDPIPEDFVDRTGADTVDIVTREGVDEEPTFVFDPPFVRVDAGAMVRWVNDDGVFHTITSTPSLDRRTGGGEEFDGSISAIGDTFEWEASPGGERQAYYCSPHASFMFGALEID